MKWWALGVAIVLALSTKFFHHQFLLGKERGILPVSHLASTLSTLYHAGKSGKVHYHQGHRISWHPPGEKRSAKRGEAKEGAVAYELSGGRLGDNLLSYLHALWLSYKQNRPVAYVPFPLGEHFALSENSSSTPVAVTVPYFPEPSMKNRSQPFYVDWDDPDFQDRIRKALAPTKPVSLIELPKDRITLAVHVRRAGRFDDPKLHLEYPLKFPPDEYYFEQIKLVASVFKDKPLYIFLFTDDLQPEELLHRYKSTLQLPHAEWACRSDAAHVLEDFFSMTTFDCFILCDSNFSIAASKLGNYAVRISPTHYLKKKGEVQITGLDIAFIPKSVKKLTFLLIN